MDICINISSIHIFKFQYLVGFEQWFSMATIPYFIDYANSSLLQSDFFFLIVIEFPHTCIA